MSQICRDCQHYCICCGICRKDFDYKKMDDSCRNFTPEDGEERKVEE